MNALVAEVDGIARELVSADIADRWSTGADEYAEAIYAPAIDDLAKYGYIKVSSRLLRILSRFIRWTGDRELGVKGAGAVLVMANEAGRQAARADRLEVEMGDVLMAIAAIGHQVEMRLPGPEAELVWTSSRHLAAAGLTYRHLLSRLATRSGTVDAVVASDVPLGRVRWSSSLAPRGGRASGVRCPRTRRLHAAAGARAGCG